ncbi:MAG: ATP-binding cassette domain-containing protein [Pseudomonadota bacterium]
MTDLNAWYGQAQALWGVSMDVRQGEVVGVLGRNGAGKTTLLRCLAGLHAQAQCELWLGGRPIERRQADDLARQGVTLLREGALSAPSLTVTEHLSLARRLARLRQAEPAALAETCELFPLLKPLLERQAGLLSGGQRQALALACAFTSRPRVLLLDEPSGGLAPPVARDLYGSIKRLAATDMAVVIVEQDEAWLEGVVHRTHRLDLGHIVSEQPGGNTALPTRR